MDAIYCTTVGVVLLFPWGLLAPALGETIGRRRARSGGVEAPALVAVGHAGSGTAWRGRSWAPRKAAGARVVPTHGDPTIVRQCP